MFTIFFFNDTATTEIYTLSLHDALPIFGRPAVKAVVPRFSDFDPYAGIAFPGGLLADWFVRTWDAINHALDRNDLCAARGLTGARCVALRATAIGVKPVAGDDGSLLQAALAERAANADLYAGARRV